MPHGQAWDGGGVRSGSFNTVSQVPVPELEKGLKNVPPLQVFLSEGWNVALKKTSLFPRMSRSFSEGRNGPSLVECYLSKIY